MALEDRPEEEGIETRLASDRQAYSALEDRPEEEGIETGPGLCSTHGGGLRRPT